MFLSAIGIWISYFVMRGTLIKSVNLQGSQYKESLKVSFLTIGFVYAIRSVYSLLYMYYNLDEAAKLF